MPTRGRISSSPSSSKLRKSKLQKSRRQHAHQAQQAPSKATPAVSLKPVFIRRKNLRSIKNPKSIKNHRKTFKTSKTSKKFSRRNKLFRNKLTKQTKQNHLGRRLSSRAQKTRTIEARNIRLKGGSKFIRNAVKSLAVLMAFMHSPHTPQVPAKTQDLSFGSTLRSSFRTSPETVEVRDRVYDGIPQAQFGELDWCKTHDCTRGVGVNRQFMPQLADNDGLKTLVRIIAEKSKVPVAQVMSQTTDDAEISKLIPIQDNALAGKVTLAYEELVLRGQNPTQRFRGKFDPEYGSNFAEKVAQFAKADPFTTLVVQDSETGDFKEFVLDGHHRYFAVSSYNALAKQNNWPQVHTLPAKRIHLPIGVTVDDVLIITLNDPRFTQRNIDDRPSYYTIREQQSDRNWLRHTP